MARTDPKRLPIELPSLHPEIQALQAADDEGFEAYVNGKSCRENPFVSLSPKYFAWLEGWRQAGIYCGH